MSAANHLIDRVLTLIVNPIIALVFAVALLYFIYGVIEYIGGVADSNKRKQGIDHMVWGLIGLTIMVTFKGIINLISNSWVRF